MAFNLLLQAALLLALGWLPLEGTCSNSTASWPGFDASTAKRAVEALQATVSVTVANGKAAKPGMFPYMALLYNARAEPSADGAKHYCGGSLIAAKVVMTAAHCTFNRDATRKLPAFVRVNLTDVSGGKEVVQRRVVKLFRHPKYNPNNLSYDVALFQLDKPVKNVRFAKLATKGLVQGLKRGNEVTVMGFGATPSAFLSKKLLYTDVNYVPYVDCYKYFRDYKGLLINRASTICAGSLSSDDACDGDDGGPLMFKGKQVGIVSFGDGRCGGVAHIRGYASVGEAQQWILTVLKQVPK